MLVCGGGLQFSFVEMVLQLNGGEPGFHPHPAQSNLKRRLVERTDFEGVVFDKNSMNVSTCFCATAGKVSYLAIRCLYS